MLIKTSFCDVCARRVKESRLFAAIGVLSSPQSSLYMICGIRHKTLVLMTHVEVVSWLRKHCPGLIRHQMQIKPTPHRASLDGWHHIKAADRRLHATQRCGFRGRYHTFTATRKLWHLLLDATMRFIGTWVSLLEDIPRGNNQ